MQQRKENVSDYKTSFWRKRSSSTSQFIRANKCVNIRISNSKEVKIMTTLLDGHGTKSSRETCRILRLYRLHHGRIPHGIIEIHGVGILQSLTKGSVPTLRWEVYTEYTPIACIMNNTVFSQEQITYVLVAQGLKARELQRHHCAHERHC